MSPKIPLVLGVLFLTAVAAANPFAAILTPVAAFFFGRMYQMVCQP